MKKVFILFVILAALLCGCKSFHPTPDINKRCYDTYTSMSSYKAEIKVTSFSNTNTTEYTATQYYKSPDMMRTESAELISIVNDRSMCVKNALSGQTVKASQLPKTDIDYMFVQNVMEKYYQGEAATAAVKGKGPEILTITVETGLSNPYKAVAEMKIETKDMTPVSLEIKGKDGNTYTKIEYVSFEFNPQLSDEIFKV